MSLSSEYWKTFWNEQARTAHSDYALNRRTAIRVDAIERHAIGQLFDSVAPRPSDLVLDAGCGSGRNLSILAPHVHAIVGVDYSPEMLARAGERISREELANARVQPADVTRLPFADSTFDAVICASVLQYLEAGECAGAMRELIRVTKPGGRLILHIKNGTSLYGMSLRLARQVGRLLGRQTKPEHYRSVRWHEKILHAAGASLLAFDGFGIFTFVPLPARVTAVLLRAESWLPVPHRLRRLAVNFQMTLLVAKHAGAGD